MWNIVPSHYQIQQIKDSGKIKTQEELVNQDLGVDVLFQITLKLLVLKLHSIRKYS